MVEHRLNWNLTILKLSFRNGQNVSVREKKANVHGVKFTKFDVSNWDELRSLRMSHFHQKTSPGLKNNHKMHLTKTFLLGRIFEFVSTNQRSELDQIGQFQFLRQLFENCKNVNNIKSWFLLIVFTKCSSPAGAISWLQYFEFRVLIVVLDLYENNFLSVYRSMHRNLGWEMLKVSTIELGSSHE